VPLSNNELWRGNFTFWEMCGMFEELVFEWDAEKERGNIREHGIGFEAAGRAAREAVPV